MSYLVTTKNYFETLVMENHLVNQRIEFTKISLDYIEVHCRFLTPELACIFIQCAKEVVNKKRTIGSKFELIPLPLN